MNPQLQRNRLLALAIANKDRAKNYRIENSEAEATIYLYDTIDSYYGVSALQFVRDLNAITAPTIHLRINSPGGDVFDGRAMATAIAQHPSNIIAHVDGLAASAASYVAVSADSVEMAPGSFMMIHKASTVCYGNAEELLSMAELLAKVDGSLVADYAKQTGCDSAQLEQWMSAETWFTAEEAVENGFADSISGDKAVENTWDLSIWTNAPAVLEASMQVTIERLVNERVAALTNKSAPLNTTTEDEQADIEHAERLRRFGLLDPIA